jgi:hypothetical protein
MKTSKTFSDACVTRFTCTTNGPQGGNASHGGYLEITITDLGGTAMRCFETEDRTSYGKQKRLVLRFEGDGEIRVARKGIKFLSRKINKALRK